MSTRCTAMTGKRHAPDGPRRCNHDTTIKPYCWQHLKEKEGLRVTKVPDAALWMLHCGSCGIYPFTVSWCV